MKVFEHLHEVFMRHPPELPRFENLIVTVTNTTSQVRADYTVPDNYDLVVQNLYLLGSAAAGQTTTNLALLIRRVGAGNLPVNLRLQTFTALQTVNMDYDQSLYIPAGHLIRGEMNCTTAGGSALSQLHLVGYLVPRMTVGA